MSRRRAAAIALLALSTALPLPSSAQSQDTLTERIATAIAKREPTWAAAEPFVASPWVEERTVARGRWTVSGRSVKITLAVYQSAAEAAEWFEKRRMVFPMGPVPAVKGYGDRAFQIGSELSFQKHNVVITVQGPMAERAARLADDAITAPVVVANCINQLLPDRRPEPKTAKDRLFRAVESGCMAEVDAALGAGADPNSLTERRGTVLRFAVSRLWGDMVHRLLAAGADPNLKDPETGVTALWGLRGDGRVAERISMLDALLAAGADINAPSKSGGSVLIDVTVNSGSNLALIEALLARGADVRLRDDQGRRR